MLKANKLISHKTIVISIVILLAAGLTYWHIARPYFAVKSCQNIGLDNTGYKQDSWRSWAANRDNQLNYMFVYEICMQKEGINP